MFKKQMNALIKLVRLSKENDGDRRYAKVLKDAMLTLKQTIEAENFNVEQSNILLDLYKVYKKERSDILHNYYYSITVKVFIFSIFASLTYLFMFKGVR